MHTYFLAKLKNILYEKRKLLKPDFLAKLQVCHIDFRTIFFLQSLTPIFSCTNM